MRQEKKLLLLAGDGIGPEVMAQVERIISHMDDTHHMDFHVSHGLVGGAAYEAHGTALSDETLQDALHADAVLLGAVGGPQWDNVAREHRPEAGLLALRKELDLYANLRPAMVFDALAAASTLKTELVKGLDMLIVRELTGGVYFGTPRGVETLADGTRLGIDTQRYTDTEIKRVAVVALELARKRGNKVHSVEKANVMETGILWRDTVTALHAHDYQDVDLHHMYADNCAMQLVRNPKQFDVIVTDNLFGDILSDCAAMLTGSLGMLPSASLGMADANGNRKAMYEPVHGSAPDIAGQGIANPLACILSFSMCLRYSFDRDAQADKLDNAVQQALNQGLRTADIMQEGMTCVSTTAMGDAVIAALE